MFRHRSGSNGLPKNFRKASARATRGSEADGQGRHAMGARGVAVLRQNATPWLGCPDAGIRILKTAGGVTRP